MKQTVFVILILFVLTAACTPAPTPTPLPTATSTPLPTPTPTITPTPTSTPTVTPIPSPTPVHVALSFFHDKNLNGIKDADEPSLNNLQVKPTQGIVVNPDGTILAPENSSVNLVLSGVSPIGKPWMIATFKEPAEPVNLERGFAYKTGNKPSLIGLADGCLTGPSKAEKMNAKTYELLFDEPSQLRLPTGVQSFPPECPFPWNYYGYGYKDNNGKPHLAFDIFALPGTEVHGVGGKVVAVGNSSVTIQNDCGLFYYGHITEAVARGQSVNRYDVIGRIDNSGNNHVHLLTGPRNEDLLGMFPGMRNGEMLTAPPQKVVPLPYFK